MKLPDKKERNEEVDDGIIFARLGPILVKNSQKWLAIFIGSVISLLSIIKEDCTPFLLFLLLIVINYLI